MLSGGSGISKTGMGQLQKCEIGEMLGGLYYARQ